MKNRIRFHGMEPLIDRREFYTVAEIADLLRINQAVIYRSAKLRSLPSYHLGRLVRFRGNDIQDFARKRRTSPNPTN